MSAQVPGPAPETQAAELARQARALHEDKRYHEARPLYERSLALVEDAAVRADYARLLATIGPL